jgi:hypothetical protein
MLFQLQKLYTYITGMANKTCLGSHTLGGNNMKVPDMNYSTWKICDNNELNNVLFFRQL